MSCERVKHKLVAPGTGVLMLLMAAGAVAACFRFAQGLGATTNLSDRYPWGLWVAIDVMSGVALAAGGFTTAALVYVFGGQKYHGLVRPAVLTGLLGYLFVVIGLVVDLARPWGIIHPLWMWPQRSAMFTVAWCEMLYLPVLALEFARPVFERFGWSRLETLWRVLSPLFCIAALALFAGITSHSWTWALVTGACFAVLAIALSRVRCRPGVPLLLIITGVVFSTIHQSSLGSLFLLMRDKLDRLWWTPSLPINFLLSAIAVGLAMVIFESTLSAKAFRRPIETEALAGLGKILAGALWIYVAYRLVDLAVQGQLTGVIGGRFSYLFLTEMVLGAILPAAMLTNNKVRRITAARFLAATLVVLGVVFNRINVAWLAMTVPGGQTYVPSFVEILITVSIIAAIVFFFNLAVKIFPVLTREEECRV